MGTRSSLQRPKISNLPTLLIDTHSGHAAPRWLDDKEMLEYGLIDEVLENMLAIKKDGEDD